MNKRQKIEKDRQTIRKYEKQLRARRKDYGQYAEAYSETGRRARALAAGEVLLQLNDKLRELNRNKNIIPGSLTWGISEQKVKDTDGKKGFHYKIAWHVETDEPYYTEEEIREELEETYKKIREETEEMYAGIPDEPEPEEAEAAPEPDEEDIPDQEEPAQQT